MRRDPLLRLLILKSRQDPLPTIKPYLFFQRAFSLASPECPFTRFKNQHAEAIKLLKQHDDVAVLQAHQSLKATVNSHVPSNNPIPFLNTMIDRAQHYDTDDFHCVHSLSGTHDLTNTAIQEIIETARDQLSVGDGRLNSEEFDGQVSNDLTGLTAGAIITKHLASSNSYPKSVVYYLNEEKKS